MVVAAVKTAARLAGQPSPAGPETARVLAGIKRAGRGQVRGLQWREADTVVAVSATDPHSIAGLRDAALVALASECLLRVSELVAVQVGDVSTESDGSGRLVVHSSKTDQEGRGEVLYVGEPAVLRIAAWRAAAAIHDGPLFRRMRRGGHVGAGALTATAARTIIRKRAASSPREERSHGCGTLRHGGG